MCYPSANQERHAYVRSVKRKQLSKIIKWLMPITTLTGLLLITFLNTTAFAPSSAKCCSHFQPPPPPLSEIHAQTQNIFYKTRASYWAFVSENMVFVPVCEQENWDGLAYICTTALPKLHIKKATILSNVFWDTKTGERTAPLFNLDQRYSTQLLYSIIYSTLVVVSEMNYTYSLVLWIWWCVWKQRWKPKMLRIWYTEYV